jgi:Lrp/AsnC family leucine-responsive transcriptional regulator
MDAIDRQILTLLQEDGRMPNATLAERVRLSPSPCLRRLKRLEADGVIAGYRALLDRRRVGLGLTVFVEMRMEAHSERTADRVQTQVERMPDVVACHVVSGSADFLLEVVVPDLESYEGFLLGRLLAMEGVADVRSNFAIRTVKPSAPLPLEHLG